MGGFMRIANLIIVAGLCLASSVAVAQPAAAPPTADDASVRADLSDLQARLFTLIDGFDHAHAGRDTIEAAMNVAFPAETDPSRKGDRDMANDLFLKGYRHLNFNQYFNPAPRMSWGAGSAAFIAPSYVGMFETAASDQDATGCLSLRAFRDHLTAQGWLFEGGRINTKHTPEGLAVAKTHLDFSHNHIGLALVVRGAAPGVDVPPAFASMMANAKDNDCLMEIDLSDSLA